MSAWEDLFIDAVDYRELTADRVLALVDFGGRGKTSGMDVGQMGADAAHVWHLSDGAVRRLLFYFDRDRALADLGLAPEADAR